MYDSEVFFQLTQEFPECNIAVFHVFIASYDHNEYFKLPFCGCMLVQYMSVLLCFI